MTMDRELADSLGCSEIAAREIGVAGQKLANAFASVQRLYDLDHVLVAKRCVQRIEAEFRKTPEAQGRGASAEAEQRRILAEKSWKGLPKPALQLLKSFKETCLAERRFEEAWMLAVDNPNLQVRIPDKVSDALAILHQNRRLSRSEQVRDGRLAYESILRDKALVKVLGLDEVTTPGRKNGRF